MNDADELMQRAPDDVLDRALRAELRWEAPPELTTRLLGLVSQFAATPQLSTASLPYARVQPRPWYATLIMALTAVLLGVSFAIAWQFYGSVGSQLGLFTQLQEWYATGVMWLYEDLPFVRYVVALLSDVRDQLHWLLLAAVLWLALDGWTPNITLRRQQQTS